MKTETRWQRIMDNKNFKLIAIYRGKACLVPFPERQNKISRNVIRKSETELRREFLEFK
jgi:hypothetical protein